MVKDEKIAMYLYKLLPHTYQYSRYSDWIIPYLDGQKNELERTNSYQYMKQKYEAVLKSLALMEKLQSKFAEFEN